MKNPFKELINSSTNYGDEYLELYKQSGYLKRISGSEKKFTELSLDLQGASIRILSNKYRKMISSQATDDHTLEAMFRILENHSSSVNLKGKIKDILLPDSSSKYLKEVYFRVDQLFKRYKIEYFSDIQEIFTCKYIYSNCSYNDLFKESLNFYLSIRYYINNTKYTFFGIFFNNNYNSILDKLEASILTKIASISDYTLLTSGKHNIVLDKGNTAILFHECCGHLLEASKTSSPFYPLALDTSIASQKLTMIDDNFHLLNKDCHDDEGVKKSKTYIIKDGKLTNWLTDKYTSFASKKFMQTGNCRRESYFHFPEPRMYCTYVENGNDSVDKILNSISDGIFIKALGDAYINHSSGNFISTIEEGYIIKNGSIKGRIAPIKIKENAKTFLNNISYISNNLEIIPSFCNSNSGLLYVEYGSPTVGVNNVNLQY